MSRDARRLTLQLLYAGKISTEAGLLQRGIQAFFRPPDIIVLDERRVLYSLHGDLAWLIAHELGHYVSYQTIGAVAWRLGYSTAMSGALLQYEADMYACSNTDARYRNFTARYCDQRNPFPMRIPYGAIR